MKSKRIQESVQNKNIWLITFNDLITLLLTFFVLIISMSTVHIEKVKVMSDSLKNIFQRLDHDAKIQVFKPFVAELVDEDILEKKKMEEVRREKLISDFQRDFAAQFDESVSKIKGIKVKPERKGVNLFLDESLLFDAGSATLRKEKPLLQALAEKLKGTDVQVAVEGHTDNVPIAGDKFSSNWELSVIRAVNIAKYIINNGGLEPKRFSAVGYAHSRPIAANDTAEGRKLNRRVNILLTIGGE